MRRRATARLLLFELQTKTVRQTLKRVAVQRPCDVIWKKWPKTSVSFAAVFLKKEIHDETQKIFD